MTLNFDMLKNYKYREQIGRTIMVEWKYFEEELDVFCQGESFYGYSSISTLLDKKIEDAINYASATNMIEDNELSLLEKDLIKKALEKNKNGESLIKSLIDNVEEENNVKTK